MSFRLLLLVSQEKSLARILVWVLCFSSMMPRGVCHEYIRECPYIVSGW